MQELLVILDAADCWEDLATKPPIYVTQGLEFARRPHATSEGSSTVMLRVPLPDGKVVVAEITLKLLQGAVAAFIGADEEDERVHGRNTH